MQYDFDTQVNRRNTNSLKWEIEKQELPMWVTEPNAFAIDVTIAAFTKGEAWLDALRAYIYENKQDGSQFGGSRYDCTSLPHA